MIENENFLPEEDDDLYEHHRIVADKGQGMMRLDQYLKHHLPNATRTKIQHAIEVESVRVNDKAIKSSYKVKPYDVITVSLPYPPRDNELVPENIPLDILYEDEELLLINKPPQMVVHPGYGNWSGTLVNALVYHFQQLPTVQNGTVRPGLVHRIDKDTSGLLVIAKTEYSMVHLAKQFYDHTIERTYYALVWGIPKQDKGTITGHIGRSMRDRKVMAVYTDGSQGKSAVTHYEVLASYHHVALVKCNLETGRTHQIRAHFQHLGHPLFGDSVYGGNKILRGMPSGSYKAFVENCFEILSRQALHAKSLGFIHPQTKQWVQFESDLPEDFKAVLAKWQQFTDSMQL